MWVSVGSGKRSSDLEVCQKVLKVAGTRLPLARVLAFRKLARSLVFLSRETLEPGGPMHRVSVSI